MPSLNIGYCGSLGSFTLSGQYRHGQFLMIPHENVPLTLFVKRCSSPQRQPCAHQGPVIQPGVVPIGSGGQYCSDGTLETVAVTTGCDGRYTVTVSGTVLAVGLAIGNWIPNPAFSCGAPPPTQDPTSTNWLPYIPDPATLALYGCPREVGAEGTALTDAIGDLFPDQTGGISDGSEVTDACGYILDSTPCMPCKYTTGSFFVTRPTRVVVTRPGDGTVQLQPQALNGSYTLDFWEIASGPGVLAYYTLDSACYMVGGVHVQLTDGCGLTETVITEPYAGLAPLTTIDWPNLQSVAISNWTADCSPPLNTTFEGPIGPLFISGPLNGPPGPTLPTVSVQIYPNLLAGSLGDLCISSSPTFGVLLQTCTGAAAERLQADCIGAIVAVSWISEGGLYTACHRGATRAIGRSTAGWEATQTVESANADNIGMVFLPDAALYLTYLLSGAPVYRLNHQFGSGAAWSGTQIPGPAVAGHSASGRGQEQAFRLRATGSQSVNGPLEFSQCRDNRGANWTSPIAPAGLVSATAQGPYCGAAWMDNRTVALFSLAQSVPGLGAAGMLLMSESTDGGDSWSVPNYIGYSGQCSSVAKTAQGVLVAAIWGARGAGDTGTTFLISRNGGEGWVRPTIIGGPAPPPLSTPPVLAALEDTVFCIWVTGNQPQFLASTDGGNTWR